MSLHIQMSEEAEAELRKSALRNQMSSLAASLMLILIGGGTLFFTALVIATEQPAEFIAYTPPSDNAAPSNNPTQQDLTSKATTPSSSVSPSVIVAVGAASPVAMAPVDIDMQSDDLGMSVDIDMGFDADMGEALGDAGAGLGSSSASGSALEGTFYDLKQTRNGAKSGVAEAKDRLDKDGKPITKKIDGKTYVRQNVNLFGGEKYMEILNSFIRTWSPAILAKYYQSPAKLYASSFYLPSVEADYPPFAYQCQDRVKDGAWVLVYRGKVRAPKSGKFRFVGAGDEVLAVRFNRKLVLEVGYCIPSAYEKGKAGDSLHRSLVHEQGKKYVADVKAGKDRDHKGYEIANYKGAGIWNKELGGLTAGEAFEVNEGQTYPIEILISEGPGGAFGMALFVDEYQDGKWKFSQKNDMNTVPLDLFRTNFSLPDQKEIEKQIKSFKFGNPNYPPYNPDSLVWVAVP